MVNGERVRQARELCGLTQSELAERIASDQSTVARLEAGEFQPGESKVLAIGKITGFPPSFFHLPDGPNFPLGSLRYRAHASVSSKEKARAYRLAQIAFEVVTRLLPKVKIGGMIRLPRIPVQPSGAARETRKRLGLPPNEPIPNVLNAIEKAGVLVLALPIESQSIDAFSTWAGTGDERPIIVVSAGRVGDRLRLSVAHDVGHLVLEHGHRPPSKEVEDEAFAFGAEFLMPEEAMRKEIVAPVTLTNLAKLKARWGVSIQALIRRGRDLGVITQRQYTYLFEQLSAKGWRSREPVFVAEERPRAVRQIAELVYGMPVDYRRAARELDLTPEFVRHILATYARGV